MGERVAAAADLSEVLQTSPQWQVANIPQPAELVRDAAALASAPPPSPESDEFKDVMRILKERYPVPA
jgi:hypothetical protein